MRSTRNSSPPPASSISRATSSTDPRRRPRSARPPRSPRKPAEQVALTLSDGFCVARHRAEFLDLIRHGVDILVANESEVTALYEAQWEDAARRAAEDVRLAVLTRSAKGSVLMAEGERVAISAEPVKVVDTTGAGDLYAAGVLFGLATGLPLETAGRLGSLAAAEVISHLGARPEVPLDRLARERGILNPAKLG